MIVDGELCRITAAAGVATEAILEPGFGTESAEAAAAPKNKNLNHEFNVLLNVILRD